MLMIGKFWTLSTPLVPSLRMFCVSFIRMSFINDHLHIVVPVIIITSITNYCYYYLLMLVFCCP
jgi:hypothetical protein